jgi:hypothetical protein
MNRKPVVYGRTTIKIFKIYQSIKLKMGIWNLEFGIWNLEFGIWNLDKIVFLSDKILLNL